MNKPVTQQSAAVPCGRRTPIAVDSLLKRVCGNARVGRLTKGKVVSLIQRSRGRRFVVACVALLMALVGTPAACHAEAEISSVELGFSDTGRVGVWLPVSVEVTGADPGTTLLLQIDSFDPAGNICRDDIGEAVAAEDGSAAFRGVFRVGRLDGNLKLTISAAGSEEALAKRTVVHTPLESAAVSTDHTTAQNRPLRLLKHDSHCVLTVGEVDGLAQLQELVLSRLQADSSAPLRTLTLPALADFPATRFALQSVDTVILLKDFTLSEEQLTAVRHWTATGGHLIVSADDGVQALLTSRLGRWLTAEFDFDPQPLVVRGPTLASFQSYVPGAKVLSTIGQSLSILRIRSDQVKQELPTIDGPLIARRGVGTGMVTVVAADLTRPPLSTWNSLPQLFEMLIFGSSLEDAAGTSVRSSRISTTGVNDLSTQLATSVDAVPPEGRTSTWVIIALLAGWTLLAGPLDYFLVRNVLKRPHLTWLTFPVLVAMGCGIVYAMNSSTDQSTDVRQVEVIDVAQSATGVTRRVRTWFSVSADTTQRTDLSVTNDRESLQGNDNRDAILSWHGRAENVYGGMYRPGGAGMGRLRYARTAEADEQRDVIEAFPLPVGGSHAFLRDELIDQSENTVFRSTLQVAGTGLLDGEFEHSLPVPIRDWVVIFGNRVYQPAPGAADSARVIEPNVAWSRAASDARASDLKAWLNGVRIVRREADPGNLKQGQTVITPYNTYGRNPFDILLMATMYELAGGSGYVGLSNHQVRHDDLSRNIRMNSALIMGLVDGPLTNVQLNGEIQEPDDCVSVIRILAPVSLAGYSAAPDPVSAR